MLTQHYARFFVLLCLSYIGCVQADVNLYFESIKHKPTALYQFLHDMPKGGELHYHYSGGVYSEVMLSYAQKKTYCLDKNTMSLLKTPQPCSSVSSFGLKPHDSWYQRIVQAWSMLDFKSGKESAHDHFFATFSKFHTVFTDGRSHFLANILQRAAKQHERYLEIMFLPQKPVGPEVEASLSTMGFEKRYQQLMHNTAFHQTVKASRNEIKQIFHETRHELECDKNPNQAACAVVVKFQCYALRGEPLQYVFAQALQAFLLAKQMDEVVGVNLVQPEDGPIALRDYKKQMALLGFLHQKFPDVSIALHAGELAKPFGRPKDRRFHVHDAIFIAKANRIGHGVDIKSEKNHAFLVDYMAKHAVPVEINLSSNAQILHVQGANHPFKYYLTHQVPLVLSTDDEGILRTSLTHEYQLAVETFDLDYFTLKQLSRNVLTYAFLPGNSLWENARLAQRVSACKDLNSQKCLAYLAHSEKGQLQRKLELDYIAFEKRF